MALMDSSLDSRVITPYLLTHKPRYSVYFQMNFLCYTFGPDSVILFRTLFSTVRWSMKYFFVITSMLCMH